MALEVPMADWTVQVVSPRLHDSKPNPSARATALPDWRTRPRAMQRPETMSSKPSGIQPFQSREYEK